MFLKVHKFKILMALLVVPFLAFAQPSGWDVPGSGSILTHTIIVPDGLSLEVAGVPVEAGDWIGVFFYDGTEFVCGGNHEVGTPPNNNVIAYGEFATNPGFTMGEAFTWKFYDTSEGVEYFTGAEYDNGGNFVAGGTSQLSGFVDAFVISASADPSTIDAPADVNLSAVNLDPVAYDVDTWEWDDGNGNMYAGQNVNVMVDATTTFTVTATTTDALTATASVTVTLSQVFAGEDADVCNDPGTYVLADAVVAGDFLTYFWATAGTGSFDDVNAMNPTYTGSQDDFDNGSVVLTLTAVGANGPVSDDIELSFTEPATVDIIPDDIYLCADATTILEVADLTDLVDAANYGIVQWATTNGAGGFDDETLLEPTYFPSPLDLLQFDNDGTPTILQIQVKSNDPCELAAVDQVNLRYVRAPEVVDAGIGAGFCIEPGLESFTFADAVITFAENPWVPEAMNTIEWTTDGTGTFDDPTLANPTYFFSADELAGTTTINFMVTAQVEQACEALSSEASIVLQLPPDAYAGPDASICEDDIYVFTESYATNYDLIQWSGINGTGEFSDENIEQPTYTPSFQDILQGCVILQIEASAVDPCVGGASDQMELCFQRNPVVIAGEDATICANESYTTMPTVEYTDGPYLWEQVGGVGQLMDADMLNATYVAANPDDVGSTVYLTLTAQPIDPCTNAVSSTMELYIECAPNVYAGEDFTVCETENPVLVGEAECVSQTMWATTGDGYFCCPDDIETTYYPGPMDKEGCVTLVLVGYPEAPCELYELDKVVVCFDPAPVVDAGPDLTVCEGESIQIDGDATDVCGIQWFVYNGNGTFDDETITDPFYTPNGQDLIAGTVQLIITGAPCGTCTEPAMDTMNLTIQPLPVVEIEEDEATICEDVTFNTADLTILVENASEVMWSTAGDGGFDNPALVETVYTPGATDIANELTVLTLTGVPTDPCTTSASDDVILNIQWQPAVNILPDDTTICATDEFDFAGLVEASNYTAVQWANVNGAGPIISETDLEPIYQPGFVELEQGFVELCINVAPVSPCVGPGATDCIIIYFQDTPTVEVDADYVETCEETPVELSATGEDFSSVMWSGGNGTFDPADALSTTYTPAVGETGSIYLCVTVEAVDPCTVGTESCLELYIQPAATADAGEDAIVCEMLCNPPWTNGQYQLMGAVEYASSFAWSTAGDGMFDNVNALDAVYTLGDDDIANGSVELCITAQPLDPCTVEAVDCMTLSVQPFPISDAGEDQSICEGEPVQLDGSTEFASGVFWDFALYGEGDGSWDNQIIEDPIYTPGVEDIERGYVELIMVAFPISPCTYPDADNMTVYIIPQPVAMAGEDITICEGESAQLDGMVENATGGFEWTTNGDGAFDPAADVLDAVYVPGANDLLNGAVELCLYAFDGSACQADYYDCLTLTILPPPVAFAGDDAVVCEGDTYLLADATADNYSTVEWSGGAGSFDDNTMVNPTYTPDASEYGTTVTLCIEVMPTDPCTVSVTDCMDLLINEGPAIGFCFNDELADSGSMFEFCFDETVTVSVCEVWAGTGPFDICYSLNGEPEVCVTDVAELGEVFSGVLPVGEHTVQITSITDANGCTALDVTPYMAYVTVNPEPAVGFCFNDVLAGTGDTFTYCFEDEIVVTLCEIWSGTAPFAIEYSLDGEPAVLVEDVMDGGILFEGTLPAGDHVVNIVSIVDANGCVVQDVTPYTANIVVDPEPIASFCFDGEVAATGSVFEYCYDETVTATLCDIVQGVGPFTIEWTVNGDVFSGVYNVGDVLFQDVLDPGTYDIMITSIADANGCAAGDVTPYMATVIVNPEPDVDFCVNGDPVGYGDEFTFCHTDMIDVTLCEILSGDGPFEVCWTLDNGPVECATVDEGGSLFNDMLPLGEHVVELISLTDANGCVLADPSLYVMNFKIVEPAALFCFNGEEASTGSEFIYCYDEEVVVTLCEDLTGTGPYSIDWTVNGEAYSATDIGVGDVLFSGLLDAGTYVVEITSLVDATGCAASDPSIYTATVIIDPEPFITFAVNDVQIAPGYMEEFCYDEMITVSLFDIWTGTAPFEVCYEVYKDGDLFIENCVTVENPGDVLESGMYEPGTYELMVTSLTDAEGCMASQTTLAQYTGTIIVNEEPAVGFCFNDELAETGSMFEYCYDEIVEVSLCEVWAGEAPFNIEYSLNGEPAVLVEGVDLGGVLYNGTLPAGEHTVEIVSITDANGCVVADVTPYIAYVTIHPEPMALFCFNGEEAATGSVFNFCETTEVDVTLCTIVAGTGPFTVCYTLNAGPEECVTVAEGESLFTGMLDPGNYEVAVVSITDEYGCSAGDVSIYNAIVNIQAAPMADAGEDLQTCEEAPVMLTGMAENYSSVAWSGGLGSFDPVDDVATTYTPAAGETGVVELCLTAEPIDPCTVAATDCMELTVVAAPVITPIDDFSVCDNVTPISIAYEVANYSTLTWVLDFDYGFIDGSIPGEAMYYPSQLAIDEGSVEICLIADAINPPCTEAAEECFTITFIPSPESFAGDGATICESDPEFPLDDAIAVNYSELLWTTTGTGTFSDATALNPIYYPGDMETGVIELCLEALPLAGCDVPAISCLDLEIIPDPVITPEGPVDLGCEYYDFVDLQWLPIPLEPEVIGGETYQWSTDGDGVFGDATALNTTYELGPEFDKWNGMVTLTLTVFGPGNCAVEVSEDFIFYVPQQIIEIQDGTDWRGISAYVAKETTSVADVMAPVVMPGENGSLIIMIDKVGTSYWADPEPAINNLGNWEPIGYQAKFREYGCLPIYGDMPYDTTEHTFMVDGPFTYLPVLTNQEVGLNDFFAGHEDDILLIYDWYTGGLWTPGPEVDPLDTIKPGFAYLMVNKFGFTPYEITFPNIDLNGNILSAPVQPIASTDNTGPWNDVTNTAQPHFILFDHEVTAEIQPGDVFGAFNQYNECVGVAEFNNRDAMFQLLAMGDDPITELVEGYEAGEDMSFKLYRPSTDETFDVTFIYDAEYPNYNNQFEVYGVSKVVDMSMIATSIGEGLVNNSINVYPNPATDVINIASDYNIKSVTMVNYVGQMVYTNDVNGYDFQINVSSFVTGMYVVNIETTDGNIITKRITVE